MLGEFTQARPGVVLARHCSCGSITCIHIRRGNSPAGQTSVCVFAGFAASSGQVLGEFPQARPGVVLARHCSCGSSTCIHVRRGISPAGQTSVCVFAGFAASSGRVLGEFTQARPGVVLARHCSCGSSTCIHVRRGNSPAGQTSVCVFAGFAASSGQVLGEFTQARPGVVLARHCSCCSSTCIHVRRGHSPAGQTRVCVFAGFTASPGQVLGEFPQARPGVVPARHCSCCFSTCIHIRRGNSPAGQTSVCVFAGFAASPGQVLGEFPQARPGVVPASHCSCVPVHASTSAAEIPRRVKRQCACLPNLRHHRDGCLGNFRRPGQV